MKNVFILFCSAILLAGCVDFFDVVSPTRECSRITKTVLDCWKNGDYETPKKFWDKDSLEDYRYLPNVVSYRIISDNVRPYFNSITARVKTRAKGGFLKEDLWLFNFIARDGKWSIYLIEEAEAASFFSYRPKGKTHMSSPRYLTPPKGLDKS